MTSTRSYDYADYWIEVTIQPTGRRDAHLLGCSGASAIMEDQEG